MLCNDEISFPFEAHSPIIYAPTGQRHNYVHSFGFESLHFTLLPTFLMDGTQLPLLFIFHGKHDGTLMKQSAEWKREWLPEGQDAWFFFSPTAFMNATIYGKYLRLVRNWVDDHLGFSPHLHLQHDRWGSHIGPPAQAILSALNVLSDVESRGNSLSFLPRNLQ